MERTRRIVLLALFLGLTAGISLLFACGGDDDDDDTGDDDTGDDDTGDDDTGDDDTGDDDTGADPCDGPDVYCDGGLMWQVDPTGGTMNWAQAADHCEGLDLADFGDWQLPSISELRSLIERCPAADSCGVNDGCLEGSCRGDSCNGCEDDPGTYWPGEIGGDVDWYWSSSAVSDEATNAWYVNFPYASVARHDKSNNGPVRCVRNN